MNIAFLTPEYPHNKMKRAGGIGASILGLSSALVAMGHNVIVLVYGQDRDDNFIDKGIKFYKIKNVKLKGLSLFLTQKKVEKLINTLCKRGDIDIVEAPDWTGFTSFVNIDCSTVIRLNGSDTYFCYLDKRKVKRKNLFLEKRALERADGIISVSKFTGEITNKLMGIDRRFQVIPNAIDVGAFEYNNEVNEQKTILYFGTLIRKKGLLELPKIFNLVHEYDKEVKLVLVGKDSSDIISGSSSTWELMKPLFNTSAFNKVNYVGGVAYTEVQKYIKDAAVCVFPSFAEALPVSWLEAMAVGKAIVASNIGWANEMIENKKEGFLVNPKHHEAYANCIIDLLANPTQRLEMGKLARERVLRDFNSNTIAQSSVDFYKSIIEK